MITIISVCLLYDQIAESTWNLNSWHAGLEKDSEEKVSLILSVNMNNMIG